MNKPVEKSETSEPSSLSLSLSTPVQEILHTERFEIDQNSQHVPVLVFPKDRQAIGADQFIRDFEKTLDNPYRRRGTHYSASVQSLIEWMAANTAEDAPVFAAGIEKPGDWKKPDLKLIGIGNYSNYRAAEWHDFRVQYAFPVSDAWTVWAAAHETRMNQADFAEFIENRIYDLSWPKTGEKLPESVTRFLENAKGASVGNPSQIFELSRGLKLTANAKLESKLDLGSGETTLKYTEEHTGAGGRPIKVPDLFYIRIPVFFGMAPALIGVRLRYRVQSGAVTWSFSLFAPEMVVAEQFDTACATLKAAKRTVWLGTPDAP